MSGAVAPDRVLLVHGLWNAKLWLTPLAWRLRQAGFQVDGFGYPSIVGGAEAAVEALGEYLGRESSQLDLVGHSLGGLIALEALRRTPGLPVRRVVCLGAPLCGSQVARNLGRHWPLAWALGRSRGLLETGCPPWQGQAQVGVVAGNLARGAGRLAARFDGPSDGTVAVAETRLPGLADHCVVAASHTGLVFSREAADQAAAFLRDGRFAPVAAAGPYNRA